jgi:DNA replication protein DnaC
MGLVSRARLLAEIAEDRAEDRMPPVTWRDVKRQRLQRFEVDPQHVQIVLAAPECPFVAGHQGSETAARAVTAFVDGQWRILVLGGSTGRGKSVAATWVAASLDGVYWISAKDVRVGEAWSESFRRALKAPILIVDDLGREATEWASKEIEMLIESRFDKGKRTLATTNLHPTEGTKNFHSFYGTRLLSRITSDKGQYVLCFGADLRGAK